MRDREIRCMDNEQQPKRRQTCGVRGGTGGKAREYHSRELNIVFYFRRKWRENVCHQRSVAKKKIRIPFQAKKEQTAFHHLLHSFGTRSRGYTLCALDVGKEKGGDA